MPVFYADTTSQIGGMLEVREYNPTMEQVSAPQRTKLGRQEPDHPDVVIRAMQMASLLVVEEGSRHGPASAEAGAN